MTEAEGKFRDKFSNTDVCTFSFIFLAAASAGMWLYCWLYGFVKSLNRHAGKTKIPLGLTVIVITSFAWSTVILSIDPFDYVLKIIANTLSFIGGILCVYISCASKRPLEAMLVESGMPRKLSWVWCVILPVVYQYHTIYNIEGYQLYAAEEDEEEGTRETREGDED